MTEINHLTTLQYSSDTRGPWRLYIYGADGFHTGGQWFARSIRYPDEEISIESAQALTEAAIAQRREVRICDCGDMLVFHSEGGAILYGEDFWKALAES